MPRSAVVVLALLAACTDPRPAGRDAARAVLAAHCGSCHTRHLDAAIPAALAIYDLDDREWAARMSDTQLDFAAWSLAEPLLLPDGRVSDVTQAERDRFAAYVAVEKAARRDAPACPPDDLLEALHAAAYHLEHGGQAREAIIVRAPLDEKTRSMLARLARASTGVVDATAVTEEIRAELSSWPCLGEEKHRRFHERL